VTDALVISLSAWALTLMGHGLVSTSSVKGRHLVVGPRGLKVQLSLFHIAAANASTLLVLPAAEAEPEADVFCGGQEQV